MFRAPPAMKDSVAFHLAVREARARDPRFAAEAYAFLCDSLEHTIKMLHREDAEDRHVAGPQLLAGFRDLALREFGPMAYFVLREWGVTRSEDVGQMVYHFISLGYFGKNETDRIEDFADGVALEEELNKSFRVDRRS
jgi:uncharacterized repeat protein (TIGR04138 family)